MIVTVTFPSNGDNITDEADDFMPYGGLTQHPLGTVSLKSTTGNSVQLLYSYGDCTVMKFGLHSSPPFLRVRIPCTWPTAQVLAECFGLNCDMNNTKSNVIRCAGMSQRNV